MVSARRFMKAQQANKDTGLRHGT